MVSDPDLFLLGRPGGRARPWQRELRSPGAPFVPSAKAGIQESNQIILIFYAPHIQKYLRIEWVAFP